MEKKEYQKPMFILTKNKYAVIVSDLHGQITPGDII